MSLFPKNITGSMVAMILSKCDFPPFMKNKMAALARNQINENETFSGKPAEAIRKVFQNGQIIFMAEFEWLKNNVVSLIEILEQNGLGLFYKRSSLGGHTAAPMPAGDIPGMVSTQRTRLTHNVDAGLVKVITQYPA